MSLRRLALLALLLTSMTCAQGQSAWPEFDGRRVYVTGTTDAGFGALEGELAQLGRAAGRAYYLVVAGATGEGEDAHHAYEDRLWETWLRNAAAAGRTLDPDRTVLILLSIGQRQISVRPGIALQRDFGLRGRRIDDELVGPYFVPLARAGDMAGAVRTLALRLEEWIAKAEAAQRQAIEARAREEGQRIAQAAAQVAALKDRHERVTALEQRRKEEGLATGDAGTGLAEAGRALATAQRLLSGDPAGAYATAQAATRELEALESGLTHLGKQREQARESLRLASAELRDLRAGLEAARLEGDEVGVVAAAAETLEERLGGARAEEGFDYGKAYAAAERVRQEIAAARVRLAEERAASAERARQRYWTHTVAPAGTGVAILGVVLGVVWWQRRRHVAARDAALFRLAALNERIVAVMQALDSRRERLRVWLAREGGDETRLTGATRETLRQVKSTLDDTWNRFVAQNDLASQAKRRILDEGWIGVDVIAEAEGLIRQAVEREDAQVQASIDAIAARLDTLEKARAARHAASEEAGQARQEAVVRCERIAAAGLPTAAFAEGLARIDAALTAAFEREGTDPVGAAEDARAAAKRMADHREWTGRIVAAGEGVTRLEAAIEAAQGLAAAARQEGMRLCEENGNPDPFLALARIEVGEARQFLNGADDAGAREQIRQGMELVERARHVVDAQRKARAFVAAEVPARRAEAARLAGLLPSMAAAEEELRRDHAAEAWAGVARCGGEVRGQVDVFARRIQEAERAAAPEVQGFFRAANELEAIRADQARTAEAIQAVHARLSQLNQFRAECQGMAAAVQTQRVALDAYLAAQGGKVQAEARAAEQTAGALFAQALALSATALPHWEGIRLGWTAAAAALAGGLRAAQQDVAAWDRLGQRLEIARRKRADAQRFLDEHTEDRQAANLKMHEAASVLQQIDAAIRSGGTVWTALAARADEASALSDRALELGRRDIELADKARDEIRESDALIASAGSWFRQGLRVELGEAHSLQSEARAALGRGDYEGAIRLVNDAERAVRAATGRAEDRARHIEEEIAARERAERRRREEQEESRRRQSASVSVSFGSSGTSSHRSSGSGSSFSSWGSSSKGSSGSSFSKW